MLKYLNENKQRWQSIADEETAHSSAEEASDHCAVNVTRASVEVMEQDSARDSSSLHRVDCCDECTADHDKSLNCYTPTQPVIESRRGSLPNCDPIAPASAGRRRNSAPVISQCAALTVKKYLLATLAEHSSSFCMQNSSSETERLFPNSRVGSVKHHVMDLHQMLRQKKSAWTAVAPFNTAVALEGRPRDRRSNSHALVFRQCFLSGRLTGRRFSSPAVGENYHTGHDCEAVPLLTPLIPATSHSALVNWFVCLLFS